MRPAARRGIRVATLVGLLLAGTLAALPWLLARWVDHALRDALAARGIHDVQIGAVRVGLAETTLEGVAIAGDALVAPRIRAQYGVADLLHARVSRLALEEVRVQGQLGGEHADLLGDLAAALLGGAGGGGGPPRFRALDVSGLRIALQTPVARVALAIDGGLAYVEDGWEGALEASLRSEPDRLRGNARLAARPEGPSLALTLAGEGLSVDGVSLESFSLRAEGVLAGERVTGALTLDATADGALGPVVLALPARLAYDLPTQRLALDATPAASGASPGGGRLAWVAQDLVLRGLHVDLALAEAPPRLRLQAAVVEDARKPARWAPLALDARLSADANDVHAWGRLSAAHARAVLHVDAHHDRGAGRGRAALDLPAVSFARDGLQPADLSPRLAPLEATRGRFAVKGEVTWGDGAPRSDLRLSLDGLSGALAGVAFTGLDAGLRLTRPWPPTSPQGQTLEAERVTLGLDFEQVAVRYALQPPGVLDVASVHASLLGGTLDGEGRFDAALPRNAFMVRATDLDLGALAGHLQLEGLDASGRLAGRLPLALRDGDWFVEDGALEAVGEGTLRYRPPAGSALASGDPRLALLRDALRDFHYRQLRITLAGALAGDLDIRLHLAGASPDFYEGHPVEFNLNLEAPVGALLRDLGEIREIDLKNLGLRQAPAAERRGGS